MPDRTIFASLIGINDYKGNDLDGCVSDVINVDRFFRKLCAQHPDKLAYEPCYLIAPLDEDLNKIANWQRDFPNADLQYHQPTYENIVAEAFGHLKKAADGDICLFYFSGHGAQMPSLPNFILDKAERKDEVLVCYTLDENGEKYLVDKELAYLLWDTLEGKPQIHCVVVMDCCHAGNNTRTKEDGEKIKYRQDKPARSAKPFSSYQGKDSGFFKADESDKIAINYANYVHLAASQDHEQSLDHPEGGLFTRKLIEALEINGGAARSYRSLMQQVSLMVSNKRSVQNPVAFAPKMLSAAGQKSIGLEDDSQLDPLDLQFLGGETIYYQPSFPVWYDAVNECWLMKGGDLHGIVPSGAKAKTKVVLVELGKTIAIEEVRQDHSLLSQEDIGNIEWKGIPFQAYLSEMALPTLVLGLSSSISGKKKDDLFEAYEKTPHPYLLIDFNNEQSNHDYVVHLSDKGEYALVPKGDRLLMFRREASAKIFVQNANVVAKWLSVRKMNKLSERFSAQCFDFKLEKIEGQSFKNQDIDNLKATENYGHGKGSLPEEITLTYVNDHQPAFRLSISIKPEAQLSECYFGALFLQNMFGIDTDLIKYPGRLRKGETLHLQLEDNGKNYKTIPVFIDKEYAESNGISEVATYLKLIVSEKPVNIDSFKQLDLEWDRGEGVLKGINRSSSLGFEQVIEDFSWSVFTTKIRIVGSL
jgi:Caspase domain